MSKLVIREWAESDRPREKLLEQGRRALTDAELLAILIGSGSREETAVELCRRILSHYKNSLHHLSRAEVVELCHFKGIGDAKAISIVAALELGRRRKEEKILENPVLNSSRRVYEYFRNRLQDLPHEEFWVLYLNTACKVLDSQLTGRGGYDLAPVDVRIGLRSSFQNTAHSMVLFHTHSPGTRSPSQADRLLSARLYDSSKVMDTPPNGHLICTDDGSY